MRAGCVSGGFDGDGSQPVYRHEIVGKGVPQRYCLGFIDAANGYVAEAVVFEVGIDPFDEFAQLAFARFNRVIKRRKVQALDKADNDPGAMVARQKSLKINEVPSRLQPIRCRNRASLVIESLPLCSESESQNPEPANFFTGSIAGGG